MTNDKMTDLHLGKNQILMNLSKGLRTIIEKVPAEVFIKVEEIRIRTGRALMLYDNNRGWFITAEGKYINSDNGAYIVIQEDIDKTIELMSNSSIYAIQEEIKNGFITISGGHRIGVAGRVVHENSTIKNIKDIAGINIRFSKQIIGAGNKVIKHIIGSDGNIFNTLIISPPQCGKTTLLRDIARQISSGIKGNEFTGKKVGIVDERSEIAGCYKGVPQNDVGPRTDVLDACPKANGMLMMIRSMSPDVIITDEIGMHEDIIAVEGVINSGVKIITSVHGYNRQDIENKPILKRLVHGGLFERVIVLGKSKGTGTVEEVWESGGS
jgi:stage III sporulation protein AA